MKPSRLPVFLIILMLCFSAPAFADPSSPEEAASQQLAGLFVETFLSALQMHGSSDRPPLADEEQYTLISEDSAEGIYRFEANKIAREMGQKVTCLITPKEAVISMETSAEEPFKHVAMEVHQRVGIFHHYEKMANGEKAVFRQANFEFPEAYYEAVLTSSGDEKKNNITLGLYQQDRNRTTAIFQDPDASWELLGEKPVKELYNPKARIQISRSPGHKDDVFGTHTLEILFPGPDPWLVFTPVLYPMWSEKNDKGEPQKFFFDRITGVYIDDAAMDSYVRDDVPFKKNEKQFAMQLDDASLEHLKNGAEIRFELITTRDETTHVVFPLRRSEAVLSKAMELYSRNGVTRLIVKVINKDYEGVKKELAEGAAVNAQIITGMPALAIAVRNKDPKMIRLLGTAKNLDTEWKNREGDGYLHTAAHYYQGTAVMDALLAIGCNPDIPDSDGRTPLSRSVCYDGFGKLNALLKAGADINAKDENGNSVLHHTARNSFTSKEEMVWYLDHDADIDARNTKGETPFMVALANQTWKHVTVFLDHDMDVTLKNRAGQSALDIAREYRDCPDLTEKIPLLTLQGEEAVKQTRKSYKNIASILEQKTLYSIGFNNKTDETIQVAIRFLNLDGDWETASWYRLYPGDKKLLKQTKNSIFYFFAESKSLKWTGTDNYRTINGEQRGMRKITIDKAVKGKPKYYDLK